MLVKDVIERIRFNTATIHDLSGKSVQNLFTNKVIVQQLKYALDKYASQTLAIESIFSFPLSPQIKFISPPPLAIRSRTYKLIMVFITGRVYLLNIPSMKDVNTLLPYEINSIPRWVIPWENELYFYPTSSNTYYTTNLTQSISATDETIPVSSASPFPLTRGRITIGNEKILYQYSDPTNFYGCVRGIEDTTAESHNLNDSVLENNCHIFYYKRHFDIPMYDNNIIDKKYADKEMEVCDEHIEIITDYTAFKLLSKDDSEKAARYEKNYQEWLVDAKYYIDQGRNSIMNGGDARYPYLWETNNLTGYSI